MEKLLAKSDFPFIEILGVQIHSVNKEEILNYFEKVLCQNQDIALINYVNAHGVTLAQKNHYYRAVINNSSVLFCDGFGVQLAGKILQREIGERMTPPDWFKDLILMLIKLKKRVFLLGDQQDVVSLFAERLAQDFPDLQIAGHHHGFFQKSGEENLFLIDRINASKADLIITGMGMPIQENWAFENYSKLHASAIFATGALFRHYLGIDKRGPKFITNHGGEWLMRLVFQPKKLWKRYLLGLPHFLYLVCKEKVKN
ncbi:WecB/TagA/CpsF family glycosyltransferase [Belliella kenyensis]|uniref:WecB/TagA/CpsF family glycosyltransferase n=1 Tax=Belliella kenyensis TaxID=1472724 RepID=A0ABV8EKH5_9BACT|nr:WecB/TagA/CpsF family glycosyltransferase [Belliella kenyensis]MCH7400524.1 WecB/TagA/CpsF family glycosyltransferase [Belliella kenyensis]MDN3604460.1 WecB/TagA/CpsF family glycosyltransferase [Belliella kenyensis]